MLTKILLTALVIAGCYIFLRHKRASVQGTQTNRAVTEPTETPAAMRYLAIGLLSLSLVGGIGFVIYDWNDSRILLDVKVINPQSGEETLYQVYKGEMAERSFETIQGQKVRTADSERLEVTESR